MKNEKGFATVFSLFMSLLLFSFCSTFVIVASVLSVKHKANHAAEEAALITASTLDCERASEIAKANDAEIKTQLGIAYVEGSQEPMKGIALLREAVAADSTNVDAQLSLGFFSMKSGQYDKAVKRFITVSKLRPDLPEVNLYLADALSMSGDKKAALSVIDKLLSTTTDSLLQASANQRKKDIQQN